MEKPWSNGRREREEGTLAPIVLNKLVNVVHCTYPGVGVLAQGEQAKVVVRNNTRLIHLTPKVSVIPNPLPHLLNVLFCVHVEHHALTLTMCQTYNLYLFVDMPLGV